MPAKKIAKKVKKVERRIRKVIKGRGDYDLGKASNVDLVKEGAGRIASKVWTTLFGNGDYTPHKGVKSNSLMAAITANGPPSMSSDKLRKVRISHRESLGMIQSSIDFQSRSYSINPGVQNTFPWLNPIAHSFQQYEIKGMVFEFLSTSANALNSTNTALGTVFMVTNYDSVAPPFASRKEMENTEFCSVTRPSRSMIHPIECKPQLTTLQTLYIRGEVDTDFDIRFYDFGRFQIATEGMQAAGVEIGELWVSYDIELLKPIDQAIGGRTAIAYFAGDNDTPLIGPDHMLANMKFHHNDIGLQILETKDGFALPMSAPGDRYWITWFGNFDVEDAGVPVFDQSHGLTLLEYHYDQNGVIINESDGFTNTWSMGDTQSIFTVLVEVTQSVVDPLVPPYIQFSWGVGWTGAEHTVNLHVFHVHNIGEIHVEEMLAPRVVPIADKRKMLEGLRAPAVPATQDEKTEVSPPSKESFKPGKRLPSRPASRPVVRVPKHE